MPAAREVNPDNTPGYAVVKTAVARRYAKALLGLIDRPAVEATRKSLQALAEAVQQSTALQHVLASPAFSADDKTAVLTALSEHLRSPSILNHFLAQLVRKNRVTCLPEIAEEFARLADEEKGTRQVAVRAPRALSKAEQDRLRDRLQTLLRHDVDVTFHEDPTLLSGLQIRIGSMVYDSSVRNRFEAMRVLLSKE